MALRKLDDIVIYKDDNWYSTFPSLVRLSGGRLLCGFRRAPERRLQPGGSASHTDPNSQAMYVASDDGGRSWTAPPTLLYAHPAAGCQDPCLTVLSDDTIIATLFAWQLFPNNFEQFIDGPHAVHKDGEDAKTSRCWPMANIGVHVLRSEDRGCTWSEPCLIPPAPGAEMMLPGKPSLGAIRGGIVELPDGALLMPVYGSRAPSPSYTYVSHDRGASWEYLSLIAEDDTVDFHEPHLHLAPSGDVVALLRTAGLDGYLAVCRSSDGGKTWSAWEKTAVWGHPFSTATLPDGRVVVAYGYRREPFGIRVLLSDPECRRLDPVDELVLRDDLGNTDIGYPWALALSDTTVLVSYYANIADGTRFIAGTFVEVS